jgi:sulfur carrier protein ThiS
MKIVLKLFAGLSELLPPEARGSNALELEITPETTVAQIIERQRVPVQSAHLVLVNGHFLSPGQRTQRKLRENDELAIWPPIAGG